MLEYSLKIIWPCKETYFTLLSFTSVWGDDRNTSSLTVSIFNWERMTVNYMFGDWISSPQSTTDQLFHLSDIMWKGEVGKLRFPCRVIIRLDEWKFVWTMEKYHLWSNILRKNNGIEILSAFFIFFRLDFFFNL